VISEICSRTDRQTDRHTHRERHTDVLITILRHRSHVRSNKLTRRVAVYLETLCNIGSKRAFPTGYSTGDTTVDLLTDATSHSCHAHIGLFTFASWLSKTITVTVNDFKKFGRYLSGVQRTAQRKDSELSLTVKMETRHPAEGPFGREFPAICNHCRVITALSCKTWKFCDQFWRLFG